MAYRHITLFRIHDGVPDDEVDAVVDALRRLGEETDEPLEWRIERSFDTRKGTVIVENSLFASVESFAAWRAGDRHRTVAASLSRIADWLVGDYFEAQ